jgi:tetratricopeptide (TPR) repeat protein
VVLAIACLLAVGTCASYARVGANGFVNYDDETYITENAMVRMGIDSRSAYWALTAIEAANWHPLTWLSLQLDASLYGLDPFGFHLTNLLWHTAAVVLLFGVLTRMTAAPWCSALVAGLFAIHPLHVESVAWAAERKDVLAGFFFMTTLWAYCRYARLRDAGELAGGKTPSSVTREHFVIPVGARAVLACYAMVMLSFVLGLLSKPMLVTLPCVLVLLDYWPLGRTRNSSSNGLTKWWQLALEKLPMFALVALSSSLTVVAQHRGEAMLNVSQDPPLVRLGNGAIAYASYIQKAFWPAKLAAFYPYPQPDGFVTRAVVSVVLLLAVSLIGWMLRAKRPYLLVGWLWFLGMLVPVIGLIQVGMQASADRYTYLPLIGIFVMVAWGAADFGASYQLPISALFGLGAASLGACALGTWIQLGYWHDGVSLWQHALRVTDGNFMGEYLLGLAVAERADTEAFRLQEQGRGDEAEQTRQNGYEAASVLYQKAIRIQPMQPEPHYALGRALLQLGRQQGAKEQYLEAIKCKPNYAEAQTNLGLIYQAQGRLNAASDCFNAALKIHPDQVEGHYNLAQTLTLQKHFAEALSHYQRALELRPDLAVLQSGMAWALAQAGQWQDAVAHYQSALRLDPGRLEDCVKIAEIMIRVGQFDDAVRWAERGLMSPLAAPEAHFETGMAQCLQSHWPEAELQFRRAVALAPEVGKYRFGLGYALWEQRREAPARRAYEEAVRLDSQWADGACQEAWVLACDPDPRVRNGKLALCLARQCSQATNYQRPDFLDVLAASLAETASFAEAAATLQKALALPSISVDRRSVMQTRLKQYQEHQAFRGRGP